MSIKPILARIAPVGAVSLDPDADVSARGRVLSVEDTEAPKAALWDRAQDHPAMIGIRETEVLSAYPAIAMKLATACADRGLDVVILSSLTSSGFARFGFRIERLPEEFAGTVMEEQIRQFWDLAIIIDASDVSSLK